MSTVSEPRLNQEPFSPPPPGPLSPAEQDRLVADWLDVLEGRRPAKPLVINAEIEAAIAAENAAYPSKRTAALNRKQRDIHALAFHHGDESPVVCFDTPSGVAVLASGRDQLDLFFFRLPVELQDRAYVTRPFPW